MHRLQGWTGRKVGPVVRKRLEREHRALGRKAVNLERAVQKARMLTRSLEQEREQQVERSQKKLQAVSGGKFGPVLEIGATYDGGKKGKSSDVNFNFHVRHGSGRKLTLRDGKRVLQWLAQEGTLPDGYTVEYVDWMNPHRPKSFDSSTDGGELDSFLHVISTMYGDGGAGAFRIGPPKDDGEEWDDAD